MCRVLCVSRSCYYIWAKALPSARIQENEELCETIRDIFAESRETYGTRRIKNKLSIRGYVASRRRIGRLMDLLGLSCKTKRRFKVTTNSKHNLPISPNLLQRDFSFTQPDVACVGDITYIWTNEGWLYLATVIDLFSRKVVGWSMGKRMKADLVNNALSMVIWTRKPKDGLIWHTDRGSQYAAKSHRRILKQHNIKQSMSRKGYYWDNAVAESFFHTLKTELIYHQIFRTRVQAQATIFEYIEVFYNRIRSHSFNNYLSPTQYEEQYFKLTKAA